MVGNMWIGSVSSVNTIEGQFPTQIDQRVDEVRLVMERLEETRVLERTRTQPTLFSKFIYLNLMRIFSMMILDLQEDCSARLHIAHGLPTNVNGLFYK